MNTNYPQQLIALARLASNGARALAISAGIDDQRFHRVFSNRLKMPADMEPVLGQAIGFEQTGFTDVSVRSAICKQIADIDTLQELGFSFDPICKVATERMINGGTSLQKYFIAKLTFAGTFRVLIVRMATIKFDELFIRYEDLQIPTVQVGTNQISFLNEVVVRCDDQTKQDGLMHALQAATKHNLGSLIAEVESWLAAGSKRQPREIAQRRPTDLVRVAETEARFNEWNEPTRQMSKTHHLYPVTSQLRTVDAIGQLADGTPVFVEVKTLKNGRPSPLSPSSKLHCQHMVVFNQTGTDTDPLFTLLYDGPMKLVLDAINSQKDERSQKLDEDLTRQRIHQHDDFVTKLILEEAKVRLEKVSDAQSMRLKVRVSNRERSAVNSAQ